MGGDISGYDTVQSRTSEKSKEFMKCRIHLLTRIARIFFN